MTHLPPPPDTETGDDDVVVREVGLLDWRFDADEDDDVRDLLDLHEQRDDGDC